MSSSAMAAITTRRVGAGTFTTRLGGGKVLFQRVPDFAAPMQQRFLRNALAWLCA